MIRPLALLALLGASGCAQLEGTPQRVTQAALGNPARSVIQPAVEAQVGDSATAARITECVIDNARPGELTRIAADATSVEGPAPDITLLIAEILQRPATSQCAAAAA